MAKYEELGKGVVKRTERRVLGLFIDGTGLDRATRRLNRKVDMSALVRGVTSGISPTVARYYTLIPYEDDSRQRAYLDAVSRAGLRVVVKRLPPKGVNRQVSVEIEMASDMVAFAQGHSSFSSLSEYQSETMASASPYGSVGGGSLNVSAAPAVPISNDAATEISRQTPRPPTPEKRLVTVVCPGRDLAYPISLINELGIDTTTADFGQFNAQDILKSAAKWIDLSDSETIWRE